MKNRTTAETGALCVFIFVFSSAFRDVYLGGVFQSVSVFVLLLIAFGIATVVGLTCAVARGVDGLKPLRRAPLDVLLMNLATAGAWICYFFALKFLDPSVVSTLFAGIGPFVIMFLGACGFSVAARWPSTRLQKTLQGGVIVVLLALVYIAATGRSGFQSADPMIALGSAGLALMAGALITIGHLYGKRLSDAGATADALVGTRFIALLIVAAAVIVHDGPADVLPAATDLAWLALAAGVLIVAPIWFNQVGMARISPLSARVITAFAPALVFALQQLDQRIAWSTEALIAILAYTALVLLANAAQGRAYRRRVRLEMQA